MALYLISYDVTQSDSFDYQKLWDRLKEIGATKILYSEYVVVGDTNKATAIYDQIANFMHRDDRLLVQEVTKDARWDKLLITDEAFRQLLAYARG